MEFTFKREETKINKTELRKCRKINHFFFHLRITKWDLNSVLNNKNVWMNAIVKELIISE